MDGRRDTGAGQYINKPHAIRLAGLADPAELIEAAKAGKFKVHSACDLLDPAITDKPLMIDKTSFFQWLNDRSAVGPDEIRKRFDRIEKKLDLMLKNLGLEFDE